MSKESKINRRKLLSSVTVASGALVGVPTISGKEDDRQSRTDTDGLPTKKEVEEALAEMEIEIAGAGSNSLPAQSDVLDSSSGYSPADMKVYVGKNKNAETPTGTAYAIETREEFYNRTASPGFNTSSTSTPSGVSTQGVSVPDTYVRKNAIDATMFGVGVKVDIGLGVSFAFGGTGVSASINLNIHAHGVTVTVFSQSIGIGYNHRGLCLKKVKMGWSALPHFTVRPCFDIAFSRSSGTNIVKLSGSIKACGDACGAISCPICHSGKVNFDVPYV